jgi:hypothetical protein
MFLFGHWIAHARVRGPYVDITFDPHNHEVAELLGTKPAPARLASLLALVLARCPDVARAMRAREAREAREADRREERKARKARKARVLRDADRREASEAYRRDEGEADRREEGESDDDEELVMLTDIAGPSDLTGLTGLTDPSDPSVLARVQLVAFSSHGSRGPDGPNGPMGAFVAIGASVKWARVVSWDTESLARLSFHVDVRK